MLPYYRTKHNCLINEITLAIFVKDLSIWNPGTIKAPGSIRISEEIFEFIAARSFLEAADRFTIKSRTRFVYTIH